MKRVKTQQVDMKNKLYWSLAQPAVRVTRHFIRTWVCGVGLSSPFFLHLSRLDAALGSTQSSYFLIHTYIPETCNL